MLGWWDVGDRFSLSFPTPNVFSPPGPFSRPHLRVISTKFPSTLGEWERQSASRLDVEPSVFGMKIGTDWAKECVGTT